MKNVATVIAGQSPPSEEVGLVNRGLPFLQGNAEFGSRSPVPKYECQSAVKRCSRGDVLLSVRAPVGAVNVADREYGIGRGLCAIRPTAANAGFIYWWLQHSSRKLGSLSTGSTFEAVSTPVVESLRFPDLELKVQQRVAAFLDRETARIDMLISEQERMIGLLAERKHSVLDTLTRNATGDVRRIKTLFTPSAEADTVNEQVLSVYRDFGVIPKGSREGNYNRTPENVGRYLLVRPGDLVVNRMKAWQGSLGISDHRGIVSGDYEVLRPTSSALLPKFAHYLLRSPRLIAEYASRSTGIRPSQWRLYWNQLGTISIQVPAHLDQAEIVREIESQTEGLEKLASEARRFIDLASERRAALISAAVTGEIDPAGDQAV